MFRQRERWPLAARSRLLFLPTDEFTLHESLLQVAVESILELVAGAVAHVALDLAPLGAVLVVQLDQLQVILQCPGLPVDQGVQLVLPSFAALLSCASGKVLSNLRPLFCPIFADNLR